MPIPLCGIDVDAGRDEGINGKAICGDDCDVVSLKAHRCVHQLGVADEAEAVRLALLDGEGLMGAT